MSDDKKKFDFSDVLSSPGMKQLIQESLLEDVVKKTSFASMILPVHVQVGIEVLSFNEGHGNAWQEPGLVHWLPGVFTVHDDSAEWTACNIRSDGMVRDRKDPQKIDCPDCAAQYAALKLKQEPDVP